MCTPPKGLCANAGVVGVSRGGMVMLVAGLVFSRRATPGIRGRGPTPPCEPLMRLLGGANVVDAPRGAVR